MPLYHLEIVFWGSLPRPTIIRLFYVEQEVSFASKLGLALCLSLLLLSGCKSEEPNPENKDHIYLQLQKETKEEEKAVEESKKALEAARKELTSTKLDRIDKIRINREIKKAELSYLSSLQKSRYLKIKTERRRVEARKEYKIAFLADQPWPDPADRLAFETHRRLRSADLNWSKRVPKLFHDNPNFGQKKAEKKQAASKH